MMDLPEQETEQVQDSAPTVVRWQVLQKLDYKNNKIEDESLRAVINKKVRVPGFAVPLSDNLRSVSDFLLVPNAMACIHVPAPPPNLIVFVSLPDPLSIERLVGPLWIEGILRIKATQSIYGSSSYEMENVTIEPYNWQTAQDNP
ncbi:MAG: DUF3299 domain-containing protein [Deltaproteobacteria bacterium]|nr:DUF3299 domain-containing protein [Deltaproteobacteria bacterium]